MSIHQLQVDMEQHFRLFERVPWKKAWQQRDTKVCLAWVCLCLFGFLTLAFNLTAETLIRSFYWLPLILIVTLICALRMSEVCSLIRAEHLGAGTATSLEDRIGLRQRWLCMRYQCTPPELVGKAQEIRRIWEERQEIQKLANNDTMAPRFSAFFGMPDSARLIGALLTIAAIFATLITLGGNIDAVFSALQDWETIVVYILLATFFLAVIISYWIFVTGMISEVGPSVLAQLKLLPTGRRVYRYMLGLHLASEPIMPPGRGITAFLRFISLFFDPLPVLWQKLKARILGCV